MIRHNDNAQNDNSNGNAASGNQSSSSNNPDSSSNNSSSYTLYLEHLGGFLPLLKGKKISKIRPEFVIYDPQLSGIQWIKNIIEQSILKICLISRMSLKIVVKKNL